MSHTPIRPSGHPLPKLPPMPAPPPKRPLQSVDMADPATLPETKLDFPIAPGPFAPTWESISSNYPTSDIEWLRESKFGIWVHFGAQSAGQSGDWYAKRLYLAEGPYKRYYDNHCRNFGHPSEAGYKDVLHTWNPDKLDPAALVQIYHDAGARFLFVQAVHHDNFDNWNSRYQPWNTVNLGPRRDLLREWADAAKAAGMRWGAAFHHEYCWWWYQTAFGSDPTGPLAGVPYDGHLTLADGKDTWWDGYDPRLLYTIDLREYRGLDVEFAPKQGIFHNHDEYARWYTAWWAARMIDVVEHYDPDFIYTDGNSTQPFTGSKSGTGYKADAVQRVIADYYNRTLARRGVVDTFSIIKFSPPRDGVVNTQEGTFPPGIKADQPWIGETPVGDWFYAPGFVYDAGSVVRYLLENASRDGATAICVSLLPDGSLDEGSLAMLRDVGRWLAINGAGIYGSRAWRTHAEGDLVDGKPRTLPQGSLGKRQADATFSPRDFRFTLGKDGAVYAYCLTVPDAASELRITSLGTAAGLLGKPVRNVTLLGSTAPLTWDQRPDALVIRCPGEMPFSISVAFRVE